MALRGFPILLVAGLSLALLLVHLPLPANAASSDKPKYEGCIVHTNSSSRPARFAAREDWFYSLLDSVGAKREQMYYIFEFEEDGFVAKLTPRQAEKLSRIAGVVSVSTNAYIPGLTSSPDYDFNRE